MTDVTNENTHLAPSIDLADLQNVVKVIDYACEQGAYRGWAVIEQVMAVRAKLTVFLNAAEAVVKEETAVETPAVQEKVKAKPAPRKATKK